MATLNSTIYKTVTPRSSTNIAYERYEFLLRWFNRYGTPEQYLFEDWENMKRVKSEQVNTSNLDRFDSIINEKENTITLSAEDIERGKVEAFNDLLESKNVIRVFRTDSALYDAGGYERIAIISGQINWQQSKQRFNIEIEIKLLDKPIYS